MRNKFNVQNKGTGYYEYVQIDGKVRQASIQEVEKVGGTDVFFASPLISRWKFVGVANVQR